MSPKQPDNTEKTQISRFIGTARGLGCDEDPAAFDEKLKVIARHKPKDEPQPLPPRGNPEGGC